MLMSGKCLGEPPDDDRREYGLPVARRCLHNLASFIERTERKQHILRYPNLIGARSPSPGDRLAEGRFRAFFRSERADELKVDHSHSSLFHDMGYAGVDDRAHRHPLRIRHLAKSLVLALREHRHHPLVARLRLYRARNTLPFAVRLEVEVRPVLPVVAFHRLISSTMLSAQSKPE